MFVLKKRHFSADMQVSRGGCSDTEPSIDLLLPIISPVKASQIGGRRSTEVTFALTTQLSRVRILAFNVAEVY